MKRKVTVQLSEEVAERLEAAAQRPGANKTTIVEAALTRFLDPDGDTSEHASLLRRLNWMSRQLEQLDRDLRVVSETTALHARYHLTVTPPLPIPDQRAACVLGAERFEVFAAQVGTRVHLGTPLMRETLDRLSATNPDLFGRDIEEGAPLGAQSTEAEPEIMASTVTEEEPDLVAAAREDGSNGGFPGEGPRPSR
jgi:predicted DNA-binding protein